MQLVANPGEGVGVDGSRLPGLQAAEQYAGSVEPADAGFCRDTRRRRPEEKCPRDPSGGIHLPEPRLSGFEFCRLSPLAVDVALDHRVPARR